MRIILGPLRRALLSIADSSGPEKVALLLGAKSGEDLIVSAVFRVDNVKESPVEFEGDPWQLVVAHKAAEKYGLDVIAVFHTHPACPAAPSPSDLEGMKRWPYPWLIACPGELRAWTVSGGGATEIEVV